MKKTSIAMACILALGMTESAFADSLSEVEALRQQMAAMQQQMQAQQQLQAQQMQQMQDKINALLSAPKPQAASASPADGPLTAHIGGADLTLYGKVDVSAESASNGKERIGQVSSNESYLGVRGGKDLGSTGVRAIFQIETMAEVSGTPTAASSLASRNSFAGIQTGAGKLMFGKYDTPYTRATASMDPFANSLGDYRSIMGNTGGEGRAEFDYRMPHSIFYDSPDMHGFTVNALFSPGQKLNDLSSGANYAFPQGELVCSGSQQTSLNGATPNAAGTQTVCNDGAFKNALSAALTYRSGPLIATAGWEQHQNVNRTSDNGGDIANESAAKIGISYDFPIGNTISAIYEKLSRGGPINPAVNERARNGYYISDVQKLGHGFDLMAAWAHAGQTPGNPKFPGVDDTADMLTVGLKYHYDDQTSLYLIGAYLSQGAGAHYGLGAGEGHGTPVLSPRTSTGAPMPGQSLNAISAGLQYAF